MPCGLDPGPSGFTPAWGAGDGFLEPELVGEFGGEEESVLPIGRHIDEALVDKLRRVEGGVEILEAADATRCIHSKSSLMPSLVMLPFIQCHQTRGRAELGGLSKPARRGSFAGLGQLEGERRR